MVRIMGTKWSQKTYEYKAAKESFVAQHSVWEHRLRLKIKYINIWRRWKKLYMLYVTISVLCVQVKMEDLCMACYGPQWT